MNSTHWQLIGAVALAYMISCTFLPRRTCGSCKGKKVKRGPVFSSAFRVCLRCGGAGHKRRFGTWIAMGLLPWLFRRRLKNLR